MEGGCNFFALRPEKKTSRSMFSMLLDKSRLCGGAEFGCCWAEEPACCCCWFLPAVLVTSGSRNESFLRGRSWCCSSLFGSVEMGTFNCCCCCGWWCCWWGDGGGMAEALCCCWMALVLVRIDTGGSGGGWGGVGGGTPPLPNQLSERSRNLCRNIFIVWPGLNDAEVSRSDN